jgi:hypothetical protein
MTFQAANLERQLERRDAQIDRMRVELEALREVEGEARKAEREGYFGLHEALAKLDKIRSRNRGTLERMQGKVAR